jgi:hypothetical protein
VVLGDFALAMATIDLRTQVTCLQLLCLASPILHLFSLSEQKQKVLLNQKGGCAQHIQGLWWVHIQNL